MKNSRIATMMLSNKSTRTLVFAAIVMVSVSCFAQQTITTPDGQTVTIPAGLPAEARAQMMQQIMKNGAPGARPTPSSGPSSSDKDKGKDGKPDAKKDGKPGAEGDKKEGPLENVKRTAEPPEKPNPKELEVGPDDDGLLYFQFRNQPWPKVLRWYADVCDLSFDWQELPGDYINLATQRKHTLDETGDLINRALLMRGFTMLQDEETLTVTKVEELNPSLVPRVPASELSNLPPHRYVRTSFSLSWLLAEEVYEEFNSMISKNGKLTPLQSTNRLEAMDAAANLRDIHEILENEQSALAMQNLAKEFPLRHARAAAVKEQLEAFLGIQSTSGGSSRSSSSSSYSRMMQQQMQQMQQQMQRQMQQAQQRGKTASGGGITKRPRNDRVYLVANERNNSLIVHAEPNKMAIIAAFITRVDVQNANGTDFQRLSTRMKVFRLASLSPGELVESLNAMDVLEPSTRLQVDENNNAIIAYASIADQYVIQSVIDRLDGSERRFEVVQLRRLEAEAVAGSIKFLMGADEEEGTDNRRRYYDYFGYGGYGGGREKKSSDKMRVGANVQDNQLLLWVNDIEMDEVKNLLEKLGEIPPKGVRPSTTRMIDASRQPETYEYLKRLKEQWDRVSPNPLQIPDEEEFKSEEEKAAEEEKAKASETEKSETEDEETEKAPGVAPSQEKITAVLRDDEVTARLTSAPIADPNDQGAKLGVGTETTAAEDGSDTASNIEKAQVQAENPPPVRIYLDSRGNLVIQSDDTEALDRLEQIMQENKPPSRPYDVFKVKYARASWVTLNLEEYFEKNKDSRPRFFSFGWDDFDNEKESQLGDKQELKFIWDNDTNSIVVQNANDLDRKTIKELIELWDVPEEVDKSTIRFTKLIKIRYSRADLIVNTIKEAYRDLLSANDSTFQGGDEDNDESKRGGGGGGVQGGGLTFTGLKGKLSLGPDALTNSILLSVEGEELMKVIEDVIKELDEAAKDQGAVEVYKVSGGLNGNSLKKALTAILGKQSQPQNKQAQNQQQANAAAEQAQAQKAQAQAEAAFSAGGSSRPSRRRGR